MTLKQLLDEAENEEDKGMRMKNRKIKSRLNAYKQYLIDQKFEPLTINNYIVIVISFYRHYEIQTPSIHRVKKESHESYKDIPSKDQIRKILESTNNLKYHALILFMFSSGTARNEACNITIKDFIEATREYHNSHEIKDVLHELKSMDEIVPTFYIIRQKTNTPYYTFCTPEATRAIIKFLEKEQREIKPDDLLFNIKPKSVNNGFQRLNDKNKMGWKKTRRFFHPHSLRKSFATQLMNNNMDSMTINFLSGRSIDETQEAYFKVNPEKLKKKYMKFMEHVTIFSTPLKMKKEDQKKILELIESKIELQQKELREIKTLIEILR